MIFNEFADRHALVEGVSRRVCLQLEACLAEEPTACIVLAGGSTPMPIYARLAESHLDWSRISAVPSDERWVAADHPASNAHQIGAQFAGSGLQFLSLVPDPPSGAADPGHADVVLSSLPVPFELVLLGMGEDGHFASLFPNSAALEAGLDPAAAASALAVRPDPLPPEAPFERISLSLSRLLQTRSLLLVISGSAKRAVLEQAARPAADPRQLPIAALLRAADERLEIFWSP